MMQLTLHRQRQTFKVFISRQINQSKAASLVSIAVTPLVEDFLFAAAADSTFRRMKRF